MILLWGLSGDGPFDRVRAALSRRGACVEVLDQRAVLETEVKIDFADQLTAQAAVDGSILRLDDIQAVYWRTYDARRVPSVHAAGEGADSAGSSALESAWSVERALAGWLEMTPALVVNRPSAMTSNGSKPFQLAAIAAQGFDTPRTLVTTDPDAIRAFWTDHGAVIYKSMSGTRSIVSRLTERHLDRLDDVAWCPTQFQQYVPGRDFRVHVVGERVHATEIVSEADDYRYAEKRGDSAELRSATIPDDIAERCRVLSDSLGLHFSGIDLRRAPDGRWFCFEVNPSPGFSYYESHTGQPIADAVAALLSDGLPRQPVELVDGTT